jgi:hypothetical protein
MIKVIDHGCSKHSWSQLLLNEPEAELVKNILFNLPRLGNFHTFICDFGHTHRLSYLIQMEKMARA